MLPLRGSVVVDRDSTLTGLKSKEKEKDWSRKGETSYLTQAIDTIIRDKEKNGKQKKEEKNRNREQTPQLSYPGPFGRLLRPCMDHMVGLFWNHTPTGGKVQYDLSKTNFSS